MQKKRCFYALLMFVIIFGGTAFASVSLPDIPGFAAEAMHSTPLSAPSGNFGMWLYRTYRSERGGILEATLLSGPGAGSLVTGPKGTKTDDRPLGFGSTYEVFTLDGKTAVFETIPSVGRSLAVALEANSTLTLESSSLGREEMEEAALCIMRIM